MVRGGVRELLFKTPEEQMTEGEYIHRYLKDDWFYKYLPFIVGAVVIIAMLFIFYLMSV
jgi:hypothetical protein